MLEVAWIIKLQVESLSSCLSVFVRVILKPALSCPRNILFPVEYCGKVKCRMASCRKEGEVQQRSKEGSRGMWDSGEPCLEKEAEPSQETGLGEGNFEGRGEVMIPERNKQKMTYPAEHMPRAWNRKHDSSFRFLCYQLITVKLALEHLAPSWVLLCRGGNNYSIQNSVSTEGQGLWNTGTDRSSWMIVFLFRFFL